MDTLTKEPTESIIQQVRRLKEANASKHGYDLRAIAAAARENQKKHPERMVTREPSKVEQGSAHQPATRPAV